MVDEDDLMLDWETFKEKYPNIDKWEYELLIKQMQEM